MKICQWCGKSYTATGDYHKVNPRKYCDECQVKKIRYNHRQYDRGNRRERAELHRQTKKALKAMEKTVQILKDENDLLRERVSQLEREVAAARRPSVTGGERNRKWW